MISFKILLHVLGVLVLGVMDTGREYSPSVLVGRDTAGTGIARSRDVTGTRNVWPGALSIRGTWPANDGV